MRVGGICGECNKYYQGEGCPTCQSSKSGESLNIILDIPAHYNRGLGEMVTGRADYRTKLKEKGLVEIGNEKKYVEPDFVRRQAQARRDKEIESVRPQAYQMLAHYEGDTRWN